MSVCVYACRGGDNDGGGLVTAGTAAVLVAAVVLPLCIRHLLIVLVFVRRRKPVQENGRANVIAFWSATDWDRKPRNWNQTTQTR